MRAASLSLLLTLALAAAAAQLASGGTLNETTGFIAPSEGAPIYNASLWSYGVAVHVQGLPKAEPRPFPFPGILRSECTRVNGSAPPNLQAADLYTCFVREHASDRYDLWLKLPGLARINANCYCYALDYFLGGNCQPGSNGTGGSARLEHERMTCSLVMDAVAADGGQRVTREQALSGQPASGHYIAVLARRVEHDGDYHVMRKDADGTWSHKFPRWAAVNRDLFGAPITDPETAAIPRRYQVCGYVRVEPTKMVIETNFPQDRGLLASVFRKRVDVLRRIPGVQVAVTALPYNASSDQGGWEEDKAWERKRGTPEYAAWKQQQRQALRLDPPTANSTAPTPSLAEDAVHHHEHTLGRKLLG